ncbi:MAG: mannose/fructose/sorbose PTS transporter subunit IIA [Atopobiaceae bacterium]|jgi:PTS system mannose-specific IIB component|nr:mannose/fructose/sorbose PTS transporter subunit IIA [Atopobiaceae bacterium]
MVGIVLATHGKFAEGIKMSGEMVFGKQDDVEAVTLMPEMGPDDFKAALEKAIAKLSDQKEVLILCDLWGGTPFNQSSGILSKHDSWAVVTGLNLPMLIEALASRPNAKSAQELASSLVTVGKDGVKVKPESLAPAGAAAAAAPVAAGISGSIPEGTVLGDGHIKFVLVRVDTRLLHGQVATTWTKQTSPDRIIVVSDGVAHDDLRKSMIEQAAPPGVHVNVVPVDKMIAVAKDPRFGATKAMLLFETPQDLLRAVEGGVDIKKVNLGSMAHSVGKVVVSNAIAMGEDDVKTLEKLQAKGITFDVRKVPADSPESFDGMLKKAKSELASNKG